jgi:hypothetical protein
MTRPVVTKVGSVAVVLLAVGGMSCSSEIEEDPVATVASATSATSVHSALSSAVTDPVPWSAWADTVVANTSNIVVGGRTLVDSYQSSVGPYGGTNVGSAAVVQAATTISNNGGVIHGTQKQHAPAGFAVVPVPSGATNLPLGSHTPGALNINTAAQSITLAPGNYVAASITVSAPGAINISPPGQVRIWVTGSLNLGGNLNLKGVPRNLAFLVTGSGAVNINGGGALYGLVFAPASGMLINSPVFGTVIGSSVTLNTGAAVHFDQSSVCGSAKAPQLDQSFTAGNGLSDGLYGRPVLMAQSYTAGISGTLQGVAIDVTAIDPSLVARIQIEAIAGGVPSNVVLGQARAPSGGDLALTTVIPFSTAIAQVAGQQYAILVDYPEAPPFVNGIQNTASWNGAGGNLYPAGTLLSTFDNGTTWQSSESDGFDLHFKTFVIPN